MKKVQCILLIASICFSNSIYFPPKDSEIWEIVLPVELSWDTSQITPLFKFLEEN